MPSPLDPFSESNLGFVEELYSRYLEDPDSVGEDWRRYFAQVAAENGDLQAARRAVEGPSFERSSIFNPPATTGHLVRALESAEPLEDLDLPEIEAEDLAERVRYLRGLRLFHELPDEEIALIARLTTAERFSDDEFLFREGEPGNSLYILVEGHLIRQHKDQPFATLNPGEAVGEHSVLDQQPHSSDVVARGPAKALRLDGKPLIALVERRPALSRGLVRLLSLRLRQRGNRQDRVNQLVHAYRVRGHLIARLDPLGRPHDGSFPELELEQYALSEGDLDSLFSSTMIAGTTVLTLREILELLRATYCGSVGVQFMHIDDLEAKLWLQARLENSAYHRRLTAEQQRRILTKLTDAEIFEQFIHRKFLGAKRFSLEGAETLIPLLELSLEVAAQQGTREVVIGMAHRGRLNVLANVMGKNASAIFAEFADDNPNDKLGRGDVKYHLGFSSDRVFGGDREMHLSLCFNPSHLEFVNPVAIGRVRSKQDRFGDVERRRCLGILIHGDAAFAGQGVVQEMFNMSDLDGYETGGTVHVIVNNQIGFTTSPEAGRSTRYATEVARMLQTPIFHVNGEDPEAVARVVYLAMEYREKFQNDVIIDMYCYRRYGHNEGDEPSYTQPVLYEMIRQRKSVREGYLDHLLELGELDRDEAEQIAVERREELEKELSKSREPDFKALGPSSGQGLWEPYTGGPDKDTPEADTAYARDKISDLLLEVTTAPESFNLNSKLRRFLDQRREMAQGERPLDWGTAEVLAMATLLAEGTRVRFSGQDSIRGTFSHRHLEFYDEENGEPYMPLRRLAPNDAALQVWNSPLSEVGVLGFEYGFSLDAPDALTLWEAQFGDFCNVAQVIIDQFITSSEDKWNRLSGLVMLLPHGFEGQGPEHSSARLERFLNLTAEDNIQVVNLTTPAQFFHCLRRQIHRPLRKPLVVMSPKSLLRHPRAISSLEDLSEGAFQRLIPDTAEKVDPEKVRRVLFTSGKLYYELEAEREEREAWDVAIVRMEQYYPLDLELLEKTFSIYPDGTQIVWVQEEPLNMGAWGFLKLHLGETIVERWPLSRICRVESASPATGSSAAHKLEQQELIEEAFAE